MAADLAPAVHRLADAYRIALLEADLRDDVPPGERSVLLAVVAASAVQTAARLGPGWAGPLTDDLRVRLGAPPGATPAVLRATAHARALATVRRATWRAVGPAAGGIALAGALAVWLWSQPAATYRGQGAVWLLAAGVGVAALGLVAGTVLSTTLVTRLGARPGGLFTQARTVAAQAEHLYRRHVAPAQVVLGVTDARGAAPAELYGLRHLVRARVGRLVALAFLTALALFLGTAHALGLL